MAADVTGSLTEVAGPAAAAVEPDIALAAPPIALGVGAFSVGYTIGTGLRKLYGHLTGSGQTASPPGQISYVGTWPIQGGSTFSGDATFSDLPAHGYWAVYWQFSSGGEEWYWDTQYSCFWSAHPSVDARMISGTSGWAFTCHSAGDPVSAYIYTAHDLAGTPQQVVTDTPSDVQFTANPPSSAPPRSQIAQGLTDYLNQDTSHSLRLWLEHELQTGDPDQVTPPANPTPDPTKDTIPDCTGLTYDPCASKLEAAGYTNVSRTFASFDDADLSKGPGEVLSLSPATGTEAGLDTPVVVHTNPLSPDMPVEVPDFTQAPGEDAADYIDELDADELQTYRIVVPVAPEPGFGDGKVFDVDPAPGTRVHKSDEISVSANPTTRGSGTCERGPGIDPGAQADPFAPFTDVAPPPPYTARDPDNGSTTVYLRAGKATDIDTGWGWRHIEWKHGWDSAAASQTELALSTDLLPESEPSGPPWGRSYNYYWFFLQNRDFCTRRVTVQLVAGPTDPAPKGIITSFAYAGFYRKYSKP